MHPATNRNACPAMDAEAPARLASAPLRTTNRNAGRIFHEACADRTIVARGVTSVSAADSADDQFRLRARSGQTAAQHVFRRGVGHSAQLQGAYLRAVARQYVG